MSDLPKIYFWPNFMTAGNLCCGFYATLNIFNGMLSIQAGEPATAHFYQAIALILGACVFDALDGRMARLTGQDSTVRTGIRLTGGHRFLWRGAGPSGA